jgi:hypothetical protein
MKEREITALEEELGYHFRRRAVIEQAVTHSSQAREMEAQQTGDSKYTVSDNEQLEFLGDAVLALVTSEELFQRFPHFREGELSKLRAHLVSERHLIRVAQQLELGHYLRLGRGEEKSGGRSKTALLVDALEAILAAIYLDGGLEVAREFVLRNVIAPERCRSRISSRRCRKPYRAWGCRSQHTFWWRKPDRSTAKRLRWKRVYMDETAKIPNLLAARRARRRKRPSRTLRGNC